MSSVKSFTIGRSLHISSGYDMDKPFFSMTVDLEENEDFDSAVAKTIDIVNCKLIEIIDSNTDE